ncbi:MAG: hypothetical protein JWP53_3156 [Conexibacter sp.]|nr:hypothetical protein [Conexibacter sp.]
MLTRRMTRPLAVVAAAVVIGGGAAGIVSATSGNGTAGASTAQTATAGSNAQAAPPAGAAFGKAHAASGSNARSGPAAGGTTGTVSSVSKSTFTVSTSAGQKVTVHEASSTTYRKGTSSASASAVKKGEPVLVLGTTNGTTITATQIIVQPTGSGSGTSSASQVIPFKRGAPTTAKQVGKVPTNYTEGSGTIVSGTTANKATQAALAAYPGGVVDRVVKLSNGEYEVHNIGVNWPHHVFVSSTFKVVGAN